MSTTAGSGVEVAFDRVPVADGDVVAAGHVAGTLSFDLDDSFATYLGWLIPWGMPLTGRMP